MRWLSMVHQKNNEDLFYEMCGSYDEISDCKFFVRNLFFHFPISIENNTRKIPCTINMMPIKSRIVKVASTGW